MTDARTRPCVTVARLRAHYRAILEEEQGRGVLPDEQDLLDKLR